MCDGFVLNKMSTNKLFFMLFKTFVKYKKK